MLRPSAETAIWSACGEKRERTKAIHQLVEEEKLTPVYVGEPAVLYHIPTPLLSLLDVPPTPRLIFLGPLDSFLWDRKALLQIFNFDYIWEVYKPEKLRKWGYYVLPVFYKDRFIARLDSRLDKGIWTIARWWWEEDITPDAELLNALGDAIEDFLHYLRADGVRMGEGGDVHLREAILKSGKLR